MAYSDYKTIAIKDTAVPSNQTNVALALVLTESDFATTANGGGIENTDTGGVSGNLTVPADFVVCTDPEDVSSSKLDFEFKDYDASTGYMVLWVEVDAISTSQDTPIYLKYGDSGVTETQENVNGTWGSDAEGIFHQGESDSPVYDSSGNHSSSADTGSPTYGEPGAVGDGIDYSPSGAYNVVGAKGFDMSEAFTFMFWVSYPDFAWQANGFSDDPTGGNPERLGLGTTGAAKYKLATKGQTGGDGTTLTSDTLYRMLTVWDGTEFHNYLDGDLDYETTPSGSAWQNVSDITIGAIANDSEDGGLINEFMIFSSEKSSDWITTTYNNQNDPEPDGTFWTDLEVPTDNLVGTDLVLSALVLETGVFGQKYDLAGADLSLAALVLGSPALAEISQLVGQDLALASLVLDTGVFGQKHALKSADIPLSALVLESGVFGQNHSITGTDLALSRLVLEQGVFGQKHALTGTDLPLSALVLYKPALGYIQDLVGKDLALSPLVLANPTILHNIILGGGDLALSALVLDTTALGVKHVLTPDDLRLSRLVLESGVFGQKHILAGTDLSMSALVLSNPVLRKLVDLVGQDLALSSMVLGSPLLLLFEPATQRLFIVGEEDRVFDVAEELRERIVADEDRTFGVVEELRLFIVQEEDRLFEVEKE